MTSRFVVHPGPLPPGVVSACGYAADGLEVGMHRGMPSPWVTLIVSAAGPVRVDGTVARGGFDPGRATSYDVLVAGLHDVAAQVEQPQVQAGVQLALHPLAVERLLGTRVAELDGRTEHADAVLGALAGELHERVGGAASLEAAVAAVVARLAGRGAATPVRPEVARAWQLLTRADTRVEQVAREVALSPRQLRSLLVAATGRSPKQLARLGRLHSTVGDLALGRPLADVAVRRGYADQAHLSREFARMVGASPRAWLAEERRNLQDGGHHDARDSVA